MSLPKRYRHRCYCCLGATKHELGPCVICASNGYLLSPIEKITLPEIDQHRAIITGSHPCQLTPQEVYEAVKFITDGEPTTYEPEDDGTQTADE